MRLLVLLFLMLLVQTGCSDDSPKVLRQKAIYFSVTDVPRTELEKELSKTMKAEGLASPGQAMIFLLDKNMQFLPYVDKLVLEAAEKTGAKLPAPTPEEEAANNLKLYLKSKELMSARESIARIESEAGQ